MSGRRVRLTAGARRAQLVDEATALIARNGYHRFSISALAAATGLTRAGVLHHVGSKEQLLLDVLAGRDERDDAAMRRFRDRDPRPGARELLDDVVRRNLAQPEIVRLYTVLAAEALDPSHPAHDYFARRLRSGMADMGALLDGFDRPAAQVAVEIYAFMDGIQLNWLRDPTLDMWQLWTGFADALFATRLNV
ncbi:helix-turn-helix domain-containing protein [Actinoplanes sp. NPDC051411]|uniref:TetR/AcrR family transcriptional regulator n=1 Tax=Actinoplanes sp. NPDC051411 TaxID=3155522 RepID=UPI00342EB91B